MRLTPRQQRAVPELRTAVMRLARRLRQERDDRLTPSQLSVLGDLAQHGPTTPGALAAMEQVRPPTMSRILAALEEDGWVAREPHPQDGRQIVITLTPQALEWIDTYREARDRWLRDRLGEMPKEERDLILRAAPLLAKLVADAPSPH